MFSIGQNLNCVTYSSDEPLIFFGMTVVDILCLKFDFLLDLRNNVRKIISQRKNKQQNKSKEKHIFSYFGC